MTEENPWAKRHPSVAHFQPLFRYDHLPEHLILVSRPFTIIAIAMLKLLQDGPELSVALRKLVEAKDCAVRQRVIDSDDPTGYMRARSEVSPT